jgi:hypothetical protein
VKCLKKWKLFKNMSLCSFFWIYQKWNHFFAFQGCRCFAASRQAPTWALPPLYCLPRSSGSGGEKSAFISWNKKNQFLNEKNTCFLSRQNEKFFLYVETFWKINVE